MQVFKCLCEKVPLTIYFIYFVPLFISQTNNETISPARSILDYLKWSSLLHKIIELQKINRKLCETYSIELFFITLNLWVKGKGKVRGR